MACERHSDPDLRQRLLPLFAQHDLDPGYFRFVVEHLDRPDSQWRSCCHSSCDPCVLKLGRVVDAARHALGRQPPTGDPKTGD